MNMSVTRIKNSLASHKSFFPTKASVLKSFPHKLGGAEYFTSLKICNAFGVCFKEETLNRNTSDVNYRLADR